MKAVVTGASGHVGSNLVRALLDRGVTVRAFIPEEDPPSLKGLDIEIVRGDVRDPPALGRAYDGADVVFHLAAIISIDGDRGGLLQAVNIDGARNSAVAALRAGVQRFVHVSSVHAFDHDPYDQPLDETRARPHAKHPKYDQSKAAGEAAVREVIAEGLPGVIVNPSGVLGPCDFGPSRMGQSLLEMAQRRFPALPNGGFDWVDVRDVAASIIAAADRGRVGENYILGGHWLSVSELAALVERITGVPKARFMVPWGMAHVTAKMVHLGRKLTRSGADARFTPEAVEALRSNRFVSSAKAQAELGHTARPLERTIRDLLVWFRRGGRLGHTPISLDDHPVPAELAR